jgi:hypothetical protein
LWRLFSIAGEAAMQFIRKSWAHALVAAIALLPVSPHFLIAAEGDGESWRERFLTEAPRKWAEYRTHSDRFQGSFLEVQRWRTSRGNGSAKYTFEFKQNRALGCALSKFEDEGNPERKTGSRPQTLWVKNSRYKFQLVQSGPKGSWLLTSREPIETQSESAAGNSSFDGVMAISNHATSLKSGNDQIPSLVAHPGFKVVGVTRIDKNGTALARVEIDFHPEREDDLRYPWLRKGWLLFDPQKYWLLVEYEGAAERDGGVGTMHGSYEYEIDAGGLPILKRKHVTYKGTEAEGKPTESDYDFQFNLAEGDVPESEFELSAFKFVEPPSAEAALAKFKAGMEQTKGKGLPNYVWVLIGAGVCGAVAIGFCYRARRRRITSA